MYASMAPYCIPVVAFVSATNATVALGNKFGNRETNLETRLGDWKPTQNATWFVASFWIPARIFGFSKKNIR
jgi:hypothetical protein